MNDLISALINAVKAKKRLDKANRESVYSYYTSDEEMAFKDANRQFDEALNKRIKLIINKGNPQTLE